MGIISIVLWASMKRVVERERRLEAQKRQDAVKYLDGGDDVLDKVRKTRTALNVVRSVSANWSHSSPRSSDYCTDSRAAMADEMQVEQIEHEDAVLSLAPGSAPPQGANTTNPAVIDF